MTLFDDDDRRGGTTPGRDLAQLTQVVRVLPDVPAMDRALDYALPHTMVDRVGVGSLVRVPLHGRRVRGWVVALGVDPDPGRELLAVSKVTGLALDAEVIELARWVAWRWAGRLPSVLRLATPQRAVRSASARRASAADPARVRQPGDSALAAAVNLLDRGAGTLSYRVSPCSDHGAIALAAAARGQALIVTPSAAEAASLRSMLGRAGATVAPWPGGTAGSLAGHSVVGGHTAVLAPMAKLAAVVVLDEHDERHENESSPTFHAREVAIERARRAGVPCLLVSPMPSLEALGAATGGQESVDVATRRAGWALTEAVDRRRDDPRSGLFSPRFAEAARRELDAGRRVVCVLNRTGRSRLLACRSCDTIAKCEACGAAVVSVDDETLQCIRCGSSRPKVCLECASHAMKVLRMGVSRAREDLAALLGCPVGLITASETESHHASVVVGTEAVLHRRELAATSAVGLVAFLDFDQELLAARYRASEQALGLLVLASRMTRGREGRVLVQTRDPGHEVIRSAERADSSLLSAVEGPRREMLGLPPAASIAAVGGEAAAEWIERFGSHRGIEVQGPKDGWWLLRAPDPQTLAQAAGAVKRPSGRLRLRVDPMQLPVL